MQYRKEFHKYNSGSTPKCSFVEGWAVFKEGEDNDEDDLIAVMDTETLADLFIEALTTKETT
jgi:hypothetical protein